MKIADFLFGVRAVKLVARKTKRVEKALRYEEKSKKNVKRSCKNLVFEK